jgi:hypothetical protein
MANFMTRVVLHDADDRETYEELHQYMADGGFSKVIQGSKATSDLPDAMYDYRTNDAAVTAVIVKELAKTAAAKTKKKHTVLTVQYTNWASSNLVVSKP